jgi:ankyrin repeat protein
MKIYRCVLFLFCFLSLTLGATPQDLLTNRTPLHRAAIQGDVEAGKLFLCHIEARNLFGHLPIHDACRNGKKDMVSFLLNQNSPFALGDGRGTTPLHFAIEAPGDNLDILELLIGWGASPTATTDNWDTPLHFAAILGKKNRALFLLEKGARVDGPNRQGKTPYDLAKENGWEDVLEILLSGPDR